MLLACAFVPTATALQSVSREFERIAAPVRDGGTFHVATGSWTRARSSTPSVPSTPALVTGGEDTLYACTASSGYFIRLQPGQTCSASGRIPIPTTPISAWLPALLPSAAIGTAPGTASAYQVDGFTIAYCTDTAGANVDVDVAFHESWNPPCTSTLAGAPPRGGPFALHGLPGRGSGAQACWTITIDLTGTSQSFALQADGNGAFDGGPADAFGWTFAFPSLTSTLAATGMLIAGAPSDATGSSHPGVGWLQFPPSRADEASGFDGRIFDDPNGVLGFAPPTALANVNGASFPAVPFHPPAGRERGADMLGRDNFRIDGGAPALTGCISFGGPAQSAPPNGPYSNFHLELYGKVDVPAAPPGVEFCAGDGLPSPVTRPCACNNVGAPGNGCASSFHAAGAHLASAGVTALDNVVLLASGMQPAGVCVFLKGNALFPAGFAFGDGITCVSGQLIRLRGVALSAGAAAFPVPPETITLSQRGANTVGSGQLASYSVQYRNAAAAFCPPFTHNGTNNVSITW